MGKFKYNKLTATTVLSFIMPVYNAERYVSYILDQLLTLHLSQGRVEIIAIDDGSKDKSAEILKSYAQRFTNLQVIHQNNSGPATARHRGLEKATGKYVWFVDADDLINPLVLPSLLELMMQHPESELISFNYTCDYNDKQCAIVRHNDVSFKKGTDYLLSAGGRHYLWNHIFVREKLTKSFIEGLHHIEDMCFIVENVIHFSNVLCVNENGYFYNCKNQTSISHSHSEVMTQKGNEDAYCVYSTLYKDCQNELNEEKIRTYKEIINFGVTGHLYTLMRESTPTTLMEYVRRYKQQGLYPLDKSRNKKGNHFLVIANHKWLLNIVSHIIHRL